MLIGREGEHADAMARRALWRSAEEEEEDRKSSRHRNGDRRRLRVVTLRITRYT